jgi:hypothetical protein
MKAELTCVKHAHPCSESPSYMRLMSLLQGRNCSLPSGYAGGTDTLQEAVDHGWLSSLLAQELAASLLVGLKIQQDHLD